MSRAAGGRRAGRKGPGRARRAPRRRRLCCAPGRLAHLRELRERVRGDAKCVRCLRGLGVRRRGLLALRHRVIERPAAAGGAIAAYKPTTFLPLSPAPFGAFPAAVISHHTRVHTSLRSVSELRTSEVLGEEDEKTASTKGRSHSWRRSWARRLSGDGEPAPPPAVYSSFSQPVLGAAPWEVGPRRLDCAPRTSHSVGMSSPD